MRASDYIWHGDVLCAVRELGSTTVALTTYDRSDGTVANRELQHCVIADSEGEISYDAQLTVVDNVREADDGKVYVAGDELLMVRAAASAAASDGAIAETAQTHHPRKICIPSAGVTDHSCATPAHETLPWGHTIATSLQRRDTRESLTHSKTMPRCERLQSVPRR